jgi:serine/threonine protein kinase
MSRFKYRRHLGTGTFGDVYECWEEDDDGVTIQEGLAIKLLKEEWLDDEEVLHRFKREARLCRGLKHPGILPVLYSNLSAEQPYIVTPLASGSLADALEEGGASHRDWALELFGMLLEGMTHAHERQVLHRDLKPDNVLYVDGVPAISDFGMGKELGAIPTSLTEVKQGMGTVVYVAPEQWENAREASYPADVYSLGKMLWELLANRAPHPGAPDLELIEDDQLRGFIERCCEEEPSLRYRDAGDALRAWKVLVGELAPVRAPLDQAQALVEEWGRTEIGPDVKVVRRLDVLLAREKEEELLYYEIIPFLPDQLVEQYCQKLPKQFAVMLNRYVQHVKGDLPWVYCDIAARFYNTVFFASGDEKVQRLVLQELLSLGARHNRYPVGDVVRDLLWNVKDRPTAQLVASVIADTPESVWYHHGRTFEGKLMPAIKKALDKTIEPPTVDDVPF